MMFNLVFGAMAEATHLWQKIYVISNRIEIELDGRVILVLYITHSAHHNY